MTLSRIAPVVACAWGAAGCAGLILFDSLKELAAFAGCFLCLTVCCTRSLAILRQAVALTGPFAVPLVAVHGILNPNFEASSLLLGWLPIRDEGVAYGLLISLRILVLSGAAIAWRFVDPDRLLRESVHLGLPPAAVVTLAVALATMRMVPAKIKTVYLAQQARGLPAGPGLAARLRALPSVIVPVVVSTLLEGSSRGELMATRGLGTTPFRMPLLGPPVVGRDIAQALLAALTVALPFFLNL